MRLAMLYRYLLEGARLIFKPGISKVGAILLLLGAGASSTAMAATLPTGFTETAITGLTSATAMAIAPDGRLFVCQQTGQLRVIKNGTLLATPFVTLTVNSSGERGLLGVAFDPNFVTNAFVYVYYTATTPAIHNRVSRFIANGDVAVTGPGSETIILDLNNLSGATNHNGGAIHFGSDGKLYIAAGENANAANSQTLNNLLGKILRINSDGTIPSDNPFFDIATGINRAIWALGLRNPFTFNFQPGTGRLFINDVGQSAWEEINDGIVGSNYGWGICEGLCSPPNVNFRDPLFQYPHSGPAPSGCAIVGAAFYNPPVVQFPSDHAGKYFFGDLCTGFIRRFDQATGTSVGFATGICSFCLVDLQVAEDGSLYYLIRDSVFRVQYGPALANSFRLSASSYSVNESGPSIAITVMRDGSTLSSATVDYRTFNSTASDRTDYTTASGTLNFAPGETSRDFVILITDDVYVEGNETVNIALRSTTGGPVLGTNNTATLTINDNDISPPTTNPADVPQFFVRQHYSDFLARDPDPGGLAFWTGRITECGSDKACINQRRIEVSAAFFIAQEFQQSGGYVYQIYKESFGSLPNAPNRANLSYAQYISDRGRVVGGANLNQSKTDFANAFVDRPAFLALYPESMTAADYVDALNANTGNSLSQAERDALIAALNNGTKKRGTVLREIAENQAFIDREYNAAFVLAQYFDYLRRDPEQGGYDFWLNRLNQFPFRDPNGANGMVCAFITSDEYQLRFSSVITHSNGECSP
jgi:glucose/arabinose dehydrogenase